MQREFLAQNSVNGVLPLLLFLMTREGYSIVNVTPVTITSAGLVTTLTNQPKGETDGVAIQFTDPRHGLRTLRYFSLNLQDSRIKRKPGTLKYLQALPEASTLVKSASYLMHKEYFSTIRDLILSKSRVVVEDDSGVPLRFFGACLGRALVRELRRADRSFQELAPGRPQDGVFLQQGYTALGFRHRL